MLSFTASHWPIYKYTLHYGHDQDAVAVNNVPVPPTVKSKLDMNCMRVAH